MIRFILVCIVVIGYLILSIPILLVEWIIGRFSPEKKDISSLRIIQAVFRFILKITGAKITVIGEENVPKDTPVLYIGTVITPCCANSCTAGDNSLCLNQYSHLSKVHSPSKTCGCKRRISCGIN